MEKVVKRLWLERLRSGNYEQGKAYLRTKEEKYCCLGVLIDVLDRDSWELRDSVYATFNSYVCALPWSVLDDVDMSVRNQEYLIWMNDNGSTFVEIADWIEENL